MDGINTNYNQYATNYPSQVGGAGETAAAAALGSVDQSQAASSGSQVRLTESTDKMSYVASHPQLAEAANLTAAESSELLQSTSEKICSAETKCRGNTVLFDIYAVMNLIQQSAQEMRNAQRELRLAENQAIRSSLLSQADLQRTAAITQLITGCVTAGISVAMMTASAYGMGKQISQTNTRQNAAGLDVMKEQQNLLACSDNPKAAGENLRSVQDSMAKNNDLKTEVDAAFKQADAPTPTETKMAACETAQKEVTAAQLEKEAAIEKCFDTQEGTPEHQAALDNVGAASAKLDAAQAKLDGLHEAVEGAPEKIANEKAAQMGAFVDKYQAGFDKATAKATNELAKNGKLSPETKQELDAAGKKLTYARALQVDACAKAKSPAAQNLMEKAFGEVTKRVENIKTSTNTGTVAQQNAMWKFQLTGQTAQLVGQLGGSVSSGVAGIMTAEVTRMQAEQKRAEEQLDQVRDLFSSSQQVVQQAIQLFQSVVAKESQSIEEIINGIKA